MYGAILGDIIGEPYEANRSKNKYFDPLIRKGAHWTDDTVLTVATAEALLQAGSLADEAFRKHLDLKNTGTQENKYEAEIKSIIKSSYVKWALRFQGAGYGPRFISWIKSTEHQPYYSCGNGSAMRVSPAGWLYSSLDETQYIAGLTAEVTHNHPDGVAGAQAVAAMIYLIRNGRRKGCCTYITEKYGYRIPHQYKTMQENYMGGMTCKNTVPYAISCFVNGKNYVDVVRNAVGLGYDTDTLGAIAGSIAEAQYKIPDKLIAVARECLTPEMLDIVDKFYRMVEKQWTNIRK